MIKINFVSGKLDIGSLYSQIGLAVSRDANRGNNKLADARKLDARFGGWRLDNSGSLRSLIGLAVECGASRDNSKPALFANWTCCFERRKLNDRQLCFFLNWTPCLAAGVLIIAARCARLLPARY